MTLAWITPHRARLLDLVRSYQTNACLASELGISVATVKRHIEILRGLTGCRSKGELAHWWADHRARWAGVMPAL